MFKVLSNSFENLGNIPKKYCCLGKDISPELYWMGLPENTKSLLIVVDDPDAKKVIMKTFVHWIVINIPIDIKGFVEGQNISLINGAREITNDFKKRSYGGPCPPVGNGEHRYYFTVFALDILLDYKNIDADWFRDSYNQTSTFCQLMQPHILGLSQIMGKYERT